MSKVAKNPEEKYFGHSHVTIIEPTKGWRTLDLGELWAYRELFWVLTQRDIKVRYKQTVLGVVWAFIQPLMAMVVFSIFFGRLAMMPSDGLPYPIFVYAALLPWTFFANALSNASNSILGSAQLVSKVYFPRLIIPLASVGSGIVDFAIATMVLLILMLFYNVGWSFNLLAAPLLLLGVMCSAVGVGTLLSALTVAYRDFRYVVPFLVQLWLFATPVIYPASLVPERWQWLLYLNPMAGTIEGFRSAFLGRPFDIFGLTLAGIVSLILFFLGAFYFERVERKFADMI